MPPASNNDANIARLNRRDRDARFLANTKVLDNPSDAMILLEIVKTESVLSGKYQQSALRHARRVLNMPRACEMTIRSELERRSRV